MKYVVTLPPEASKRLIAKAIVKRPEVQEAFKNGYIILSLGTTCGFIAEELCGSKIPRSIYACGYISSRGPCLLRPHEQYRMIVFDHGQLVQLKPKNNSIDFKENLIEYLDKMTSSDLYIKGGNVVDASGKVGVLIGEKNGGEIGITLPYIKNGVSSIIPMPVSKTIPGSIDDIIDVLKDEKVTKKWCDAEPHDMITLPGKVITEINAVRELFEINMYPAALGGIGGSRGAATFIIDGPKNKADTAYKFLNTIRDEYPLFEVKQLNCIDCPTYKSLRK